MPMIHMFGLHFNSPDDKTTKKLTKACANYIHLQLTIMDLDESDLLNCILIERNLRRRTNILNRLYSRFYLL